MEAFGGMQDKEKCEGDQPGLISDMHSMMASGEDRCPSWWNRA